MLYRQTVSKLRRHSSGTFDSLEVIIIITIIIVIIIVIIIRSASDAELFTKLNEGLRTH